MLASDYIIVSISYIAYILFIENCFTIKYVSVDICVDIRIF